MSLTDRVIWHRNTLHIRAFAFLVAVIGATGSSVPPATKRVLVIGSEQTAVSDVTRELERFQQSRQIDLKHLSFSFEEGPSAFDSFVSDVETMRNVDGILWVRSTASGHSCNLFHEHQFTRIPVHHTLVVIGDGNFAKNKQQLRVRVSEEQYAERLQHKGEEEIDARGIDGWTANVEVVTEASKLATFVEEWLQHCGASADVSESGLQATSDLRTEFEQRSDFRDCCHLFYEESSCPSLDLKEPDEKPKWMILEAKAWSSLFDCLAYVCFCGGDWTHACLYEEAISEEFREALWGIAWNSQLSELGKAFETHPMEKAGTRSCILLSKLWPLRTPIAWIVIALAFAAVVIAALSFYWRFLAKEDHPCQETCQFLELCPSH